MSESEGRTFGTAVLKKLRNVKVETYIAKCWEMSRLEAINEHDTHAGEFCNTIHARGVELRANTEKMLRNVKDQEYMH